MQKIGIEISLSALRRSTFARFPQDARHSSPLEMSTTVKRIGIHPGLWKLAVLVVLSSTLPGCDFLTGSNQDSPESKLPRNVFALGRLEPAGGIISISAIPGERLQVLDPDVKENQLVPKNGVLGLLASYDLGKAQLNALIAKKDLAEKKRKQDLQMVRAQKAQAEAAKAEAVAKQSAIPLQEEKLRLLKEASQLAIAEHQRMYELSLADPELVNPHELAKKRNEMDLAIQDQKIAADKLSSAKEAGNKAILAAEENVRVAVLSAEQIEQGYDAKAVEKEIAVAEETLKRSVLLSPHVSASQLHDVLNVKTSKDHEEQGVEASDERPYTVLKVFLSPGEFITQTPIVQVADLRSMICIAEVHESDVKEIKERQKVTIRSPSFSGDFADGPLQENSATRSGGMRGTVQSISRIIAPPGVQNRNPLAPADRSVVEVRISIDDPAAVKHARSFVSMDVTVEFDEQKASEKQASKPKQAAAKDEPAKKPEK